MSAIYSAIQSNKWTDLTEKNQKAKESMFSSNQLMFRKELRISNRLEAEQTIQHLKVPVICKMISYDKKKARRIHRPVQHDVMSYLIQILIVAISLLVLSPLPARFGWPHLMLQAKGKPLWCQTWYANFCRVFQFPNGQNIFSILSLWGPHETIEVILLGLSFCPFELHKTIWIFTISVCTCEWQTRSAL